MLPPTVLELVPAGHLAHFVRDTVRDDLDLSSILSSYREERGHPPYHPAMMTALLLYGYSRGIRSSRKIEAACEERVDFMAVTGRQTPDHRTINDFRKRHLEALKGLFKQVLDLCAQAGLVKLGHVALDGTKVKANASKRKAMSYGRMKKTEPRLASEVAGWFEDAERIDTEEDALYGADKRGDELPDWVKNKQKRREKMREAMAELEAEAKAEADKKQARRDDDDPPRAGRAPRTTPKDKAQRNFTDPESRIMKGADGYLQAYNCQVAVDAESHVIVAQLASNNAADQIQLKPIVAQIKDNTGRQAKEFSADAGYCTEDNLKELSRRHIRGYVATGRRKHEDAVAQGLPRGAGPRAIAMRTRLRQGGYRSRYRLRKQTAEPVIGNLKDRNGLRQFLLRGLAKVAGEWSLACTAHNLLKLAAARA